jgi:hypothetical protein
MGAKEAKKHSLMTEVNYFPFALFRHYFIAM